MEGLSRKLALALFAGLAVFGLAAVAPPAMHEHHIVIQVSENDAAIMNLALNNAANVSSYYDGIGDRVAVEIVAYGPGLNMFREDTSPVKARLTSFKEGMPNVTFSACNVTLQSMEKAEGKHIDIVPEAHMVPSGVVRITTLQEQGWTYVKP